ncbi:MAG: hypothetical protein ACK4I8_10025, partial [Armatimonadota bacterium]
MKDAVVVGLIAIFVALWTRWTLRSVSQQPLLRRKNYLGEEVVNSAGLAFVGSSILGWLFLCWRGSVDWHEGGQLMFAALWFGALGLLDDLALDTSEKGLRGHLRAFFRERKITTGFVKLVGGGLGAMLLSSWILTVNAPKALQPFSPHWFLLLLLWAIFVALGANTLNLLDVRPSRALKGFWMLSVIGLLVSQGQGWQSLLPLLIGTLAYAPADFGRKVMMGDAGSNPLGACFGVWALNHWMETGHWSPAVWVLLAVFVALHVYAERRSLTDDIKRIP